MGKPLVASLTSELEDKKQEGLALLKQYAERADKENREFTDEERAALKKITDDGAALQARLTRAQGDDAMVLELRRITDTAIAPPRSPAATRPGGRPLSLGEQFTSAPEYDFFRKGLHRTTSAWTSPSQELVTSRGGPTMRAATLTEDPASGGALVVPQYLPGILPLQYRRLVVADLIAPGTTTSNQVNYMREKTFTNAANTVLEGAAKPESTLTFEAATAPVRKIAHWLPVTEEMLEDVAQISSYIDARLQLGVMLEEEDQLLQGTGVAPDILGLRITPGLAADVVVGVAPDTNADAILRQIMAIFATSFLMPDGIVMHPTNWTTTLLTKTAQGNYLTGGPFSPIQTPTLWGLPTAITPVIPAGVALVGAYQTGAQVFRRGGIRVEGSNSHQDFFIKNLVALRAEERLALACYRPGAFGEVTSLT